MKGQALIGASSATLVILVLSWLLPGWLGLEGPRFWALGGGLSFLGILGGVLIHRILAVRARKSAGRPKDPVEEELDVLFREARERLAAGSGRGRLGRIPVLLLLGPPESTKTTTVVRSGLEPELLAGRVHSGDTVAPTETANLWYADGFVVAEAGSPIIETGGSWARFLQRLRPARLGAAFLRRAQAARVAVVCVACDEFLKPGGSGSVPELARNLRARLAEAAGEFGIQLPVYVLFTRADRLPHFPEFVRNLTADEAAEVLGATLPFRDFRSSGGYTDEQGRRLAHALDEMHRGLAAGGLDLLGRENSEEVRQAAYEFPREFRKLSEDVRAFLLELCRPGHLGSSPVLRGFYFTGARPVIVSDRVPAAALPPQGEEKVVSGGATQVFRAPGAAGGGGGGTAAPAPSSRKVPQWVFLPRIFQEVILQDRIALGLTGSGRKVGLVRRAALGAAAVAALVALGGMTVSYFANRSLQHEVGAALERAAVALEPAGTPVGSGGPGGAEGDPEDAREDPGGEGAEGGSGAADGSTGLAGERGLQGVPAVEALGSLDSLGAWLDRLREWDEGRPPLRYRWGLYQGSRLLPHVRTAYFQGFDDRLWQDTRARLLAFLDGLPDEPGEDGDYDAAYGALRAYLVVTDHPDRSAPETLAPVLERLAGVGEEAHGDEREALYRSHYQRFARELPHGNPYDHRADRRRVDRTRDYLGRFAALDQLYQGLVSGVGSRVGAFDFESVFPDAPPAVRNDRAVPGAFTREGWAAVQEILADPEALLVSEEWVVGEGRTVSPEERRTLVQELGEQYEADYLEHWVDFLRRTSVPRFATEGQAAQRLDRLSRSDSPVVQLLSAVSRHTAVDSEAVRTAFRPVHRLVPPEDDEEADEPREVGDYLADLADLQASVDELDRASDGDAAMALGRAEGDARQANRRVGDLARDLPRSDGAGRVADEIERILRDPVEHASALLGGFEVRQATAEINQAGQAICQAFDRISGTFPFAGGAGAEADVDDVTSLLHPAEGRLVAFRDEHLDDLVTLRGGRYEAESGASPAPDPGFLRFLNRAHEAATALFPGGDGPRVEFALAAEASERVPEIEVALDGPDRQFTRTRTGRQIFVWEADRARTARIRGRVDGREEVLREGTPEGPWAIFRLFRESRWERLGDGSYEVVWPGVGPGLTVQASPEAQVFRPGFLEGLDCPPRVVR